MQDTHHIAFLIPVAVGIAAVIVNEQLDLFAVHAALGVDLLNIHINRLLFRIAKK